MHHKYIIVAAFVGAMTALLLFYPLQKMSYRELIKSVTPATTNQSGSQTNTTALQALTLRINALESQLASNGGITITPQPTLRPTTPPLTDILDKAYVKGGSFSTSSYNYTPMGMFVNVSCPTTCSLWINFYSSSKNQGTPASATGYTNAYALFVDGSEQGVFTQASFPAANAAVPVALNALIPAGTGNHTVEVRSKTNGGVLQSDSSVLQVLSIK